MTNATIHIAAYYPFISQRSQVEELDLAGKSLEGELDFTNLGFTNLKQLNLANNKLTKLVLANPTQLTYLDVSDNKLTSLNTSELGNNLTYGEIKNNSLPDNTKKDFLIKRWNYYKAVEVDYPDKLVPGIMKLIDITDLDNYITNYDFAQQGNPDYHRLIGSGYTYLDEYALEFLSQQVLARALIKQNELVNKSGDEGYEQKINNLARQFQRAEQMELNYPLEVIQRELWKELNKEKDLTVVFQNQLQELATLLDPQNIAGARRSRKTFSIGIPDHSAIKNKIQELQNTTTRQQAEIVQLKQMVQDKEQARQTLTNGISRLKAASTQAINEYEAKLVNLQKEVESSSDRLTVATYNEELCRQKITDLETQLQELEGQKDDNIVDAKEKYNALIKERDQIIDKYHQMKKQLDQAKRDLQTEEMMVKKLKGEDRINYWKWGLISLAILAGAGLIWWGYQKVRSYFK